MFPGKIDNLIASCGHCPDFRVEPIDTLISIHVQVRDKAAPDKTYPHFWHR